MKWWLVLLWVWGRKSQIWLGLVWKSRNTNLNFSIWVFFKVFCKIYRYIYKVDNRFDDCRDPKHMIDILVDRHWKGVYQSPPSPLSTTSFTLCLVGGIIGRMENNGWKMVWKTVFSTVWEAKENREDGKSRRKFSSQTHQFFSSQIGRKTVERKLLLTWNYTNALSHLPSSQTQRLSWNKVQKKKTRAREF